MHIVYWEINNGLKGPKREVVRVEQKTFLSKYNAESFRDNLIDDRDWQKGDSLISNVWMCTVADEERKVA